ncbi:Rap1a/Tai family immunity protein [Sphingomonas sp. BK235]|uniref:Rap1a/Tai family immunity protein n=1 Tax=Sphingomonas sp. BK235 TaxID=2512131 RepID=UPI0010520091|nr:Rap1a/Tai family immunity protein [Sphingomonas sp. BK235]TCP35067.1 hypothetical protein EV292_103498 [Sphingomonas sp. BK235]
MSLFLALLAAAADRPVVVSSITTPQLVELCRGKDDDPTANFCTGYILAEFDALSLARQICPSPARASNMKVAATVRKYLRKRGRKATAAPAFVVRDALRAAYPCKRR